jgi:ATP-binding cassette subfamily B protein
MPRPGKIQGPTEKANDLKKAMGSLLKYVRPYALRLIIVTIFAVGSTIFSIVGPKVLAKATDKLAQGVMAKVNNTGGIDFKYILHIAIILIVLYLISAFFSYIQGWIVSGVSQEVAYSLRKDLSEKMNRLPLSYFDKHASGDILSRVTNDIDTIAQSLNQSLSQMITSFTTVVGILIMMLSISWQMTLIALLILPLSLTLIALLMKKSQKYFSQQQTALGDVDGHIEEIYGGHLVVKAFNGEEEAIDKFNTYNASLYESAWKSQFFGSLMMPISQFVGNLGYVAVCIVGGYLATGKIITIGDIQAFVTYVRNFNQPISQLAQVLNLLQSAGAASERFFEFLEEKELDLEEAEVSSEDVAKMNAIKGVLFKGVSDSGRMKGRKALVEDGYDNHKDYFDDFFKEGKYANYSRVALNNYVEQNSLIKVGKLYKIGKIVVISYNDLRKQLEEDKIIKGLNYGF